MPMSINDILIKCPACSEIDLQITHIETTVLFRIAFEKHKHYCVCKACGQNFGHYVVIDNRDGGEINNEIYTRFLPSEPHNWTIDG